MNFFATTCREPSRTDKLFGLCDGQAGGKAYSAIAHQSKWIATVKNSSGAEVNFTAIDKCVLYDHDYPGRGRCDGMLTSNKHLYLVELKDKIAGGIPEAKIQLESTIRFLLEFEDLSAYKFRKAFVCNKKHKTFTVIDNETNKKFYDKTTFRLDIQAEVIFL